VGHVLVTVANEAIGLPLIPFRQHKTSTGYIGNGSATSPQI